ncbi:hypothetical protein Drose_13100 [Dactylosporangium roseum]|uniref:Exo-alpha-sialidase n=1 Tax=Dactylosporangium roseum TaxID=47989 RepID=A0ABY5ZAK5_9ACTN|nr:hypothetical protein [Dactylosporangium roseum]UWZ39071.1 hypothetical protein Drose_13100 [Dactylosporangium roseum]
MSDDPTRFAADLRRAFDAGTVAQAVRQPALDDLHARTGARRRMRMAGIALALAPLLGAAVIVPSTVGQPGPDQPVLEDVQGVQQLVFFSPAEAVAVREIGCTVRFTVTTDGGRSWSAEQASREPLACPTDPLTRASMLPGLQILDIRTYRIRVDGMWQLTRDSGTTWQPAASAVTMVDAFPPGARVLDCGVRCGLSPAAPFAIDPASGAVFQLRLTELAGWTPVAYTMAGERLWALLADSGLRSASRIAWSTDRGATWQSRSLEPDDMPYGVVAGPTGQAHVLFARRNDAHRAERLLRTTDGGVSWSSTATDLVGDGEQWPLAVTADGALITAEHSGSARASRDGTHFTRGPVAHITGGTPGNGAGHGLVWLWEQERPGTAYVTGDAGTWTAVPLPA